MAQHLLVLTHLAEKCPGSAPLALLAEASFRCGHFLRECLKKLTLNTLYLTNVKQT